MEKRGGEELVCDFSSEAMKYHRMLIIELVLSSPSSDKAFVLLLGSMLLGVALADGARGPEDRDKEDHKKAAN